MIAVRPYGIVLHRWKMILRHWKMILRHWKIVLRHWKMILYHWKMILRRTQFIKLPLVNRTFFKAFCWFFMWLKLKLCKTILIND